MSTKDVLAVIVSYNGLDKTRANVEALRGQVGHIHIVDNGSEAPSLAVLDEMERAPGVSVARLGQNRGIGHVLNLGVRRAREMGYSWLLTMDQDSVADPGMMRAFQDSVARDPSRVFLTPTTRYVAKKSGSPDQVVEYAITSGNLVRLSVFEEVGLYDERLFIDCIDFDFSLRVRRAGHTLYRVSGALMRHQLGESLESPFIGGRFYVEHSPLRRYYMYRNYLYVARRYFRDFPGFVLKLTLTQLLLTVLVVFHDPKPMESFSAIVRGVRDYFAHRDGPYMERGW